MTDLAKEIAKLMDAHNVRPPHPKFWIELNAIVGASDSEALRKALYELLYVSFPPVGADTPELVKAHHEAVRRGCELLGIDPNPIACPTSRSSAPGQS